jgi:oxalate decarboxylase/phosphoglucose isomerase-like protein (cupin superfamily)
MTDGLVLAPGQGRVIAGGGLHATVKVARGTTTLASTFEIVVPPGFDVGAHVHAAAEELFYVLEGELDLLAFEPGSRAIGDWHEWTSDSGQRFMRGGQGSLMFVPKGCPHAFANPSTRPARMLFQAAPAGHEDYLEELATLMQAANGRPDPAKVAELRRRYDIEQLTALRTSSIQAAR